MPPLGLYVHVPFCARKCAYCDFASWPGRENDMPRYADAVCAEIARRAAECGHPAADTVFFGGGTPSFCPRHCLDSLRGRCGRTLISPRTPNGRWNAIPAR